MLLVLEDRTVYVDGKGFGVNTAIPVERNFRSNLFREVTVPLMHAIRAVSEPAWYAIKSAMGTWSSNPVFSEGALFAPTERELRERIGAEIASVAVAEQAEATTVAKAAVAVTVTEQPAKAEPTTAADLAAIFDEEEGLEENSGKSMLEILQQEAVASPPEEKEEAKATGAETPEQEEPKREWGGKLELNLDEFNDILNDLD